MVSRGVAQLKNIRLYFCDYGGSSAGVRSFLQSDGLVNFINQNEHVYLEIYMRRNHHPYISSTYINGYVKDQPLRNYENEQILEAFKKVNREFGRKAIEHNRGNIL